MRFGRVILIIGVSHITPGYQSVPGILEIEGDDTEIAVIDANKSEADDLWKEELHGFQEKRRGQFRIEHMLTHSKYQGHVNAEII